MISIPSDVWMWLESHFTVSENCHGLVLSIPSGFSSLQTRTILGVSLTPGRNIEGFSFDFPKFHAFSFSFLCVTASSSQIQLILIIKVDFVFANFPAQ